MSITQLAPCGTRTGYDRHLYHGESPCDSCREARRKAQAAYRERKRFGAPLPDDPIQPFQAPAVGDAWRDKAACRGLQLGLFFSEYGMDTSAQAIKVCDGCPVRRECLEYAMETGEMHGVWGGTTPNRRRLLVKYRAINSPVGWPYGDDDGAA